MPATMQEEKKNLLSRLPRELLSILDYADGHQDCVIDKTSAYLFIAAHIRHAIFDPESTMTPTQIRGLGVLANYFQQDELPQSLPVPNCPIYPFKGLVHRQGIWSRSSKQNSR